MADRDLQFTLIGDMIGSKSADDRALLQRRLRGVLDRANAALEPALGLEPTIGDEFQGCFDNLADAIQASLMIRLDLLRSAEVDTRYGLGCGAITVFSDAAPMSQDGPGWWSARAAIEGAAGAAKISHTAFTRTLFEVWGEDPEVGLREKGAVNAFLTCRDAMIDGMTDTGRRRLYGLLRGWSQAEIAAEEGKTQGAISQSLSRSGAFAILAAQRQFEEGNR